MNRIILTVILLSVIIILTLDMFINGLYGGSLIPVSIRRTNSDPKNMFLKERILGTKQYLPVNNLIHFEDVEYGLVPTERLIVIFTTLGQLGNRLSTYATALALSHKFANVTFAITPDTYDVLKRLLNHTSLTLSVAQFIFISEVSDIIENVHPNYFKNDMISHVIPTITKALAQVQKSGMRKILLMHGYPGDLDLFGEYRTQILQSFVMRDDVRSKAETIIRQTLLLFNNPNTTLIGFHIRRGDYLKFSQKRYGHSVPGIGYYEAAMRYFRETFSFPVFLVRSDDLSHAKESLSEHRDVVIIDEGTAEVDLALLWCCQHVIMTLGSFGFWGGFIPGGKVVYFLPKSYASNPYVHPHTLRHSYYKKYKYISI